MPSARKELLSLVEFLGKSRTKAFEKSGKAKSKSSLKDDLYGKIEYSKNLKQWGTAKFRKSEGISVWFEGDGDELERIVARSKPLWRDREKLFNRVRKRVLREEFEDAAEMWEDEFEKKLTKKEFLKLLPSPRQITFSSDKANFFELTIESEELFDHGYAVVIGNDSGKIVDYSFY